MTQPDTTANDQHKRQWLAVFLAGKAKEKAEAGVSLEDFMDYAIRSIKQAGVDDGGSYSPLLDHAKRCFNLSLPTAKTQV